jgi:hypothetical protein
MAEVFTFSVAWSSPWINSADADFTSQRFREREGIEGQQQFVVLAQLVGEEEANRDELNRLASAFGGDAFDRVEFVFQDTGIHVRLHRNAGGTATWHL